MKIRFISACIVMLLLVGLLVSCGGVDPLTTENGGRDTKSPSETSYEVLARPEGADWSRFEAGEDDGTNDVFSLLAVDGDWVYPQSFLAYYTPDDKRDYMGKEVQTAYKFNLLTRDYSPVCLDPVCRHSTNEKSSECPFAGGFRVIGIEDDRIYYVSRYPSSEDDDLTTFHPSIYVYDTKSLACTRLCSSFLFMDVSNYFQLLDGKIYYIEDELTGDYAFDRYLCAYDLNKGKSARLMKYDSFYFTDTTDICDETIVYERGLNLRAVDRDGRAYFQTVKKKVRGVNEDGLECWITETVCSICAAEINDENSITPLPDSETSSGICAVGKGIVYLLDKKNSKNVLYAYDVQDGKKVVDEITGGARIYGDMLIYRKTKQIVMKNLETGEEQFFDLPESAEGTLPDNATVVRYEEGRIFLKKFSYITNPAIGDGEIVIFDLVTNQLYPLHYQTPEMYESAGE